MRDWIVDHLYSLGFESASVPCMKAVALVTYLLGMGVNGFYLFAQASSPADVQHALPTFLASAGPAGALVWFLIWSIGRSDKRDEAKDARHLMAIKDITATFTENVEELRTRSEEREKGYQAAIHENTKVLSRVEAKCPLDERRPPIS
jgi:hypothetical protein